MPSRIEIDGVAYELGGAMLELVNCATRIAEFSLLLTGKRGETYWLTGTVEPAPRSLDTVEASQFRVGRESIETLIVALAGKRHSISPTNPDGILLRAQRLGPTAFYLSTSFDVATGEGEASCAVIEVTAHIVGLHEGVPH